MIIAIDGPAGAGKSTIACLLAKKLNYRYLSTGAMYRAVTLKALELKIPIDDENKILAMLKATKIEVNTSWKDFKIFVDGVDVTKKLNSQMVSNYVTKVAEMPKVRKYLRKIQRKLGKNKNIVIEGRDIGTVVFPNADFKFYIDASVEERTKRRLHDLSHEPTSYHEVKKSIIERDAMDRTRKVSPLKKAKSAIHIDTTNLTQTEVAQIVYAFIKWKKYTKH